MLNVLQRIWREFWDRMPYKARFSRIFLKKKDKLPSEVKARLVEALRGVLLNPYVGVPLVGPLKGL